MGTPTDYDEAKAAIKRAIALDPDIAETHVLMLFVDLAHGPKNPAQVELEKLQQKIRAQLTCMFDRRRFAPVEWEL